MSKLTVEEMRETLERNGTSCWFTKNATPSEIRAAYEKMRGRNED